VDTVWPRLRSKLGQAAAGTDNAQTSAIDLLGLYQEQKEN
jgi:hypothetical protein